MPNPADYLPPLSTTHSPGPWSLKETEAHPYEVHLCDAYGQYIADITSPIPVLPYKGFDALGQRNLELIRSGPELLAALQDMVSLAIKLGNLAGGTDTSADLVTLRRTQALIAKVRGQ